MKRYLFAFMGFWLFLTCEIQAQLPQQLVLEKISEPNEKAFTLLKPKGWLVDGGIVRWDPVASGEVRPKNNSPN